MRMNPISLTEVQAAYAQVEAWVDGDGPQPGRNAIAQAVRLSARYIAQVVPGQSVELRVPPFVAVQCIQGPRHTRGTPPNVVEMPARTWLQLIGGKRKLRAMNGQVDADIMLSGSRADELGQYLPLWDGALESH